MGDRSYATLTIYRALGEDRLAIQRILDQELGPPSILTAFVDGEEIAVEEMSLGGMSDIADQIHKVAPNAIFEAQQAEYADSPGEWVLNTPETGYRHFDTDQSGNITLTHDEAVKLINDTVESMLREPNDPTLVDLGEELKVRLRDQLGRAAYAHIDKYRNPDVPPKFNTQEEADAWLESRISTP